MEPDVAVKISRVATAYTECTCMHVHVQLFDHEKDRSVVDMQC